MPKPLPCKAELNLSGRAQNAVSGLGDIDGIELAIAEFAKTGNRKCAAFEEESAFTLVFIESAAWHA